MDCTIDKIIFLKFLSNKCVVAKAFNTPWRFIHILFLGRLGKNSEAFCKCVKTTKEGGAQVFFLLASKINQSKMLHVGVN